MISTKDLKGVSLVIDDEIGKEDKIDNIISEGNFSKYISVTSRFFFQVFQEGQKSVSIPLSQPTFIQTLGFEISYFIPYILFFSKVLLFFIA